MACGCESGGGMGYRLGLILTLVIVMAACGGSEEVMPTPSATPLPTPKETANTSSDFRLQPGPDWPIESRILRSDVVARVKLRSVGQVVERNTAWKKIDGVEYYVVALEFTFDVLEYLKGSGGSQMKVIADDADELFKTEAEALAQGPNLLSTRITQWDDREAIVFVSKRAMYPSLKQTDRYWLSEAKFDGGELYTIANYSWRVWLPDAATPVPASKGTSGQTSSGDQKFLLEEPSGSSADGSGSGSSQSSPATVTLSALKTLIARLDSEVKTGVASKEYVLKYNLGNYKYTEKDYAWCLSVRYYHDSRPSNERPYFSETINVSSGSPSGTKLYQPDTAHLFANQTSYHNVDWVSGRDADLVTAGFPFLVQTARPLPAGEYKFFYFHFPFSDAICDMYPKWFKERFELLLKVTAPTGTVHEAFFDPVGLTSGVGLDNMAGSFMVGGTSASIASLVWGDEKVTLVVAPYADLTGYRMEFIELDGEVSLTLNFDDGTLDVEVGTHSWEVAEQPWDAGDKLMLRIR